MSPRQQTPLPETCNRMDEDVALTAGATCWLAPATLTQFQLRYFLTSSTILRWCGTAMDHRSLFDKSSYMHTESAGAC